MGKSKIIDEDSKITGGVAVSYQEPPPPHFQVLPDAQVKQGNGGDLSSARMLGRQLGAANQALSGSQ